MWNRWQCWIRRVCWFLNGGVGDGHIYIEDEVHHGMTVSEGHCELCGKHNWSWGEREVYEELDDERP